MSEKKIFQLPWKTRLFLAFFFVFVMSIGVLTFLQYRSRILSYINQQTEESLVNVGAQNIQVAEDRISDRQRLLRAVAREVAAHGEEEWLEILERFSEIFGFYSMGVIDDKGTGRTTAGEVLELGEREYVKAAMEGEEVLTEEWLSENREEWLNIFAVPVENAENGARVLTAAYRTEDFVEILNIRSFHNQGGSLIVKPSGELVASPTDEKKEEVMEIASYLQEREWKPKDSWESNIQRIGEEGNCYLVCIQKLPVNDWSLLTYVKEEDLNHTAEILGRNILYALFFLYLVILGISVFYFVIWQKFRQKMIYALFTEPYTGEWNEQYFYFCHGHVEDALAGDRWIVCFDIDRFKMLNLLYGAEGGKEILKAVCSAFRSTFPKGEIYHCHRDIFLAVLEGKNKDDIREKLEVFLGNLKKKMDGRTIPRFSLSFGVSSERDGRSLERVCTNAEFARQEAKERITDKCIFYGDTLQKQLESGSLEMRFPEAVRKEEFQVWYQPKYNLCNGNICGGEALVRWKDGAGELISPARFVPVFESTGQIVELDEEVLRMVCKDIGQAKEEGLSVQNISVNLSKLHVIKPGIVEKIRKMTRTYKISNKELSFEITESAAEGKGREALSGLVKGLQEMGYSVNMDDYGTGSSTLRSLADTQFDVLKLDRSFVNLIGEPRTDIIITSTIRMAESLGMEVVAEGVETKEQADFLLRNGCYVAQGYYFSKPVSGEEFFQLMTEGGAGK